MKRSYALMGPGTGPRVQVRGEARLQVSGLREGDAVYVQIEEERLVFFEDGLFELPACSIVVVTYEGQNRAMKASVLMGGRDAVPSA